jgi:Mrp family chromosome partitioning ATPase/capsular polysaccharide biosynthesis protein
MTSNPVLKTLRKSWWVIALFTLLGLGVAQVVVALSPTLYSSTDTLYVSSTTKPGDSGTSAYEGNLLSQDRVKSYKELLASGMIAGYVADRVGGGTTAGELQANTEVANQPETTLLTVTVSDPSPERAAQIANAYGDVFGDSVRTLEKPQDPAAQAPVTVRTAFPATPYPVPISPRPGVALPVGLLLGLVAGIGVAMLRRRLDDRVDDAGSLAALVGTRDLGPIRSIAADQGPVMVHEPLSGAAEDVRRLRGSLRHAVPADRPAVVLIAGAEAGEGRTTTAIELAAAISDTGDRVLLLEADLRRPSIASRLGLAGERGLVSVLSWECTTAKAVQRHGPGLDVVVAGSTTVADCEWLSSSLLSAVIHELAAPYDWVIVDSPPLTTAADAAILAPLATGVVVLARHGRTSSRTLRRAADGLVGVGATILGTTLVGAPAPAPWRDRLLRALSVPPAGATSMAAPATALESSTGTAKQLRGAAEQAAIEAGPTATEPEPESEPVATEPAETAEPAEKTELVALRTSNGTPPPAPEPRERTP